MRRGGVGLREYLTRPERLESGIEVRGQRDGPSY